MNDFIKKTLVGGAIMTLIGVLAWKFSFILSGIVCLIILIGLAHSLGDLLIYSTGDPFISDHYDD